MQNIDQEPLTKLEVQKAEEMFQEIQSLKRSGQIGITHLYAVHVMIPGYTTPELIDQDFKMALNPTFPRHIGKEALHFLRSRAFLLKELLGYEFRGNCYTPIGPQPFTINGDELLLTVSQPKYDRSIALVDGIKTLENGKYLVCENILVSLREPVIDALTKNTGFIERSMLRTPQVIRRM